jgi:hypothetical protein
MDYPFVGDKLEDTGMGHVDVRVARVSQLKRPWARDIEGGWYKCLL